MTTLRIVRGLQARGLMARKRSRPTAAEGVDTPVRGRELAASVTEQLMAPLAVNERERFQGLLRKLCAGLEPQECTKPLPPGCSPNPHAVLFRGSPCSEFAIRTLLE